MMGRLAVVGNILPLVVLLVVKLGSLGGWYTEIGYGRTSTIKCGVTTTTTARPHPFIIKVRDLHSSTRSSTALGRLSPFTFCRCRKITFRTIRSVRLVGVNDRPKSAFGEVPPPLTFGDEGPAAVAEVEEEEEIEASFVWRSCQSFGGGETNNNKSMGIRVDCHTASPVGRKGRRNHLGNSAHLLAGVVD
jgi:hypothetical protein